MKYILPYYLLLAALLSLVPGAGRAQCPTTPLPPGCAADQVFQVVDVATGQAVQALCVGQQVRFVPGCGRTVDPTLLYYTVQATTGLGATNINCNFINRDNTYTPTAAGFVTVAELTNKAGSGAQGDLYARNLRVYGSPPPFITLTACLHDQVGLTITTSGYDQYYAQVNSGPLIGPLAPGTVSLPAAAGSTVTVTGRYLASALCVGRSFASVPALPSAPATPVLSRLTTSGPAPGTVVLAVGSLPPGYYYDVQRAEASSPTSYRSVLAVSAGSTSVTVSNPAPGLYRVGRRDFCQTDSAFSASVPTLELSATPAGNNLNTLSWRVGGAVPGYTLLRDGTAIATLPATATTYADAAVTCGTRYTYQLQATTASGSLSVSNAAAVTAVSTQPPPAPLTLASFDLQNRVGLSATGPGGAALPAGSTVVIARQGGGGAATFTAPVRRDSTALAALLADPPCYAATVRDVCGNTSAAGPATCPVLLTVTAADPQGLTAQLSWTALRGPGSPAAGVSYRVLTLAPDGTVLATSAATAGLSYLDAAPPTDRQVLRYRVEATGAGLLAASYSNVATLARQPVLVVPNAFTPNGDGLNDALELKGRYLAAYTFVVVDRNGQEVFRATDRSQTWDGTIRGHAPVNAAYVWRFTMTDEAGQPFSQTGSVSILK